METSVTGNSYRHAVVGMGMNINQVSFPPELAQPVSLRQITGTHHPVEDRARELCHDLENRYQQWLRGKETEMLEEYNDHLFARGKTTDLRHGGTIRSVRIRGVDRQGQLLVHTDRDEAWSFGEVDWIPGSVR